MVFLNSMTFHDRGHPDYRKFTEQYLMLDIALGGGRGRVAFRFPRD